MRSKNNNDIIYCAKPYEQWECKNNKCPIRFQCSCYIEQDEITAASNTTTIK